MTSQTSRNKQLNNVPWLIVAAIAVMYTQGVWSAIGIPTLVPRAIGELSILVATLITVRAVGIRTIYSDRLLFGAAGIFGVATVIALALSEDTVLGFMLFIRLTAFTLFVLLVLRQGKYSSSANSAPAAIFELLFVLQILVSIGKLAIVGPTEKTVGTISLHAGELSVIYPAVILALTFPLMGATKSWKTRLLAVSIIIGAFIMVIAGDKRAFLFVFFGMLSVYAVVALIKIDIKIVSNLRSYFSTILILGLLGIVFSIFIVKFSPSLNPEQSRWGSFSFSWVKNYSTDYVFKESTEPYWTNSVVGTVIPAPTQTIVGTVIPAPTQTIVGTVIPAPTQTIVDTRTPSESDPTVTPVPPPLVIEEEAPDSVTLGRLSTFKAHLIMMSDDRHLLTGYGPGVAIDSSLHHSKQDVRRRFDFAWTVTGFNWLLLQIGLIGALGFVAAFAVIGWRGFQSTWSNIAGNKHLGVLVMLVISVVMFDLFFYGLTIIGSGIFFPVFTYFIANALSGHTSNIPIIRWLDMPGDTTKQKLSAAFVTPFSSNFSSKKITTTPVQLTDTSVE